MNGFRRKISKEKNTKQYVTDVFEFIELEYSVIELSDLEY